MQRDTEYLNTDQNTPNRDIFHAVLDFTNPRKADLIQHTEIKRPCKSDVSRKKEAANRNSEVSFGHLFCPYEERVS